jgi:hypothetical protein
MFSKRYKVLRAIKDVFICIREQTFTINQDTTK